MNDQKILELMAQKPDIRAVQICDVLDQPLVDVSAALRSLVEVGDVVKHSGTSPHGQPAQLYNLSPEYRKSREGKALLERIAATPAAQAPAASAPSPDPVVMPVFTKQTEATAPAAPPAGSKVDRAVAHVLKNKSVSDDELRTVMDIAKPAHPAAYLVAAIKAGKLHKEDGLWKPGPAAPAEPVPTPAAQSSADAADYMLRGLNLTTQEGVEQYRAALTKVVESPRINVTKLRTEQPAPAATSQPIEPTYRCALWSDDILEVRRNGETVAELPKAAGESLAQFLARLAGVQCTQ